MVTHLLGWPGQLSACSSDSIAPFVFFSFFTSASTAFFTVLLTLEKIFRLGAAENLGCLEQKEFCNSQKVCTKSDLFS
jgi:hypothetical protein